MRIWKWAVSASVVLVLAGCGQPAPSNSPQGLALTDSDLKTAIKANIDSDAELRAANLMVDADSAQNRASISGTVSSEELRTRAIDLAHGAGQNIILDTRIDVRPPNVAREDWTAEYSRTALNMAREAGDTVSNSLDDTWIHTKIAAKFVESSEVRERKINIDVAKKVVTLRGMVDTAAERDEAVRLAMQTEGVSKVINRLVVRSS